MSTVHVVVGVILDSQHHILITRRADSAHQGGLWEFPGGKVEEGETLVSALSRELQEELGISIGRTSPLIEIAHDYGDKSVLLDVHIVWDHSGVARGLEQQPLEWVAAAELKGYSFPEANVPIIAAVLELLGGDEDIIESRS